MANDVIKQAESKMKDVIDALNRNLAGIRTATANSTLR